MPLAAQLLQLAVLQVSGVTQGLLVQVEVQLPCPALAHDIVSSIPGCDSLS